MASTVLIPQMYIVCVQAVMHQVSKEENNKIKYLIVSEGVNIWR